MHRAVQKLFPPEYTCGVDWPVLQDLLLADTFCDYHEFLEYRQYDSDLPLGPALLLDDSKAVRAWKAGEQKGHFFSKDPIPQLIPLGLTEDDHFDRCTQNAKAGVFPFQDLRNAELDVAFAAWQTVRYRDNLANWRSANVSVVRQLADRLRPLNARLQKSSQCAVSGNMHVALLAYLLVLMRWPDYSLAQRFLTGFRVVEMPDVTGVFRAFDDVLSASISKKTLIDGADQYRRGLMGRIPTAEQSESLILACHKDEQAGFAGPLLSEQAMNRIFPGGWAPVERFDLVQVTAAGEEKHRPIDNARRAGHNEAADAVEKLDLCAAHQPALHVQALSQALEEAEVPLLEISNLIVETGGEDLPDAYRYIPVSPLDADVNIVAVWDYRVQEWRYQQV